MQPPSTPPSATATAFCPADEIIPYVEETIDGEPIFKPIRETAGAAKVIDIENPNPDEAAETDAGTLLLSIVTLPPNRCILGSYFYPAVVITVTSGEIHLLIEHWPGVAAAPQALIVDEGDDAPEDLPLDGTDAVDAGDWVRITNESFVGFANKTDAPAEFIVAGIKPDGDPGGGDCSGSCRGRP
jgi:hypothetical protein